MAALEAGDAPLAVAVSGGADSLALLHLTADWAAQRHLPPPAILTVDHRLQKGSADVAAGVIRAATERGLPAEILVWRGPKPEGDIEAAAREARYRLMGRWCRQHGIARLLVAHTREDQAETVLLRLARGSGLDGLSAMQPRAAFPLAGFGGMELLRPLLDIPRAGLRDYLSAKGLTWHEDPMNADPRFARVRLRQAWPALEAAGLSAERVAAAAGHLSRARQALEAETDAFLAAHSAETDAGQLVDGAALCRQPREIGLRALAALLLRVGGDAYRPRFERLERLYDTIRAGQLGRGRTLGHCRIGPAGTARFGAETLMICREAPRRSNASKAGTRARNRRIDVIG